MFSLPVICYAILLSPLFYCHCKALWHHSYSWLLSLFSTGIALWCQRRQLCVKLWLMSKLLCAVLVIHHFCDATNLVVLSAQPTYITCQRQVAQPARQRIQWSQQPQPSQRPLDFPTDLLTWQSRPSQEWIRGHGHGHSFSMSVSRWMLGSLRVMEWCWYWLTVNRWSWRAA